MGCPYLIDDECRDMHEGVSDFVLTRQTRSSVRVRLFVLVKNHLTGQPMSPLR